MVSAKAPARQRLAFGLLRKDDARLDHPPWRALDHQPRGLLCGLGIEADSQSPNKAVSPACPVPAARLFRVVRVSGVLCVGRVPLSLGVRDWLLCR